MENVTNAKFRSSGSLEKPQCMVSSVRVVAVVVASNVRDRTTVSTIQ